MPIYIDIDFNSPQTLDELYKKHKISPEIGGFLIACAGGCRIPISRKYDKVPFCKAILAIKQEVAKRDIFLDNVPSGPYTRDAINHFEKTNRNDLNRREQVVFGKVEKPIQASKPPVHPKPKSTQHIPNNPKEFKYFEHLWKKDNNRTIEQKILALLNDYTKNNSVVDRFFAGHWNRNHIKEVHAICMSAADKKSDVLLAELNQIVLVNKTGTLATIMDVIDINIANNDNVFTPTNSM